jgi:hypothetical protein
MHAEADQRRADRKMELAIWPDAYVEEKPKEISFEHLGGKKIHHFVAEKMEKPIDFSHPSIGGKRVGQSIAPLEEPEEKGAETYSD